MLKIFITAEILADIIGKESVKNERESSIMYRILKKKYAHIYVGTIAAKSISKIANFKQMIDSVIDSSKKDYVDNIPYNPKSVLEEPNAIFILNISKEKATDISRKYGVLCFSTDDINEKKLLDPNLEYSPCTNDNYGGWEPILHSVNNLPINSLVLIDRYLFVNDKSHFANGINSVYSILKTLLPEEFDKQNHFHVTIVFDPELKRRRMDFAELASKINKKKHELSKPYFIDMELIGIPSNSRFYNDTHNRRIISNYFIVRAEHQLGAFFGSKSSCSQTLTPQRLFTFYSLNGHSDPPLKSIAQTSNTLRELSNILKQEIISGACYYALNGKQIGAVECKKAGMLSLINRRIV